ARPEQRVNRTRSESLVSRRLPLDGSNAVKANETEFGAEPEITVQRLGDGVDGPFEIAITDFPRSMRVLTDVECRGSREGDRAAHQEHANRYNAASSHVRSIHRHVQDSSSATV